MTTLVGKTLGKYKITESIGKGGMAEVYKAHHEKLNRFVTIKVLHSYLAEGEDFTARFEREAKAVATLRHPHIVQIHDFDTEDDIHYMVMEYIGGGTLQAYMKEFSKSAVYMPIGQVLLIVQQVAEALDYAHTQGILHRDIKPSNILLDSSGNAYLADFGIARVMSATQFTSTGALIGTPTYMSPEQGLGLELTPASDIYSLGIVLYELLTGRVPFVADTPLAILHKHVNESMPRPGLLRSDLPAALEQVMLKGLAKEPASRYQTAMELVDDVEKTLKKESIFKLDSANTEEARSISALPTMLTKAPLRITQSQSLVQKPAAIGQKPAEIEKAANPEVLQRSVAQPAVSEEKFKAAAPAMIQRPRSRLVLIAGLAIIGVILAGLALVILKPLPSANTECRTVDDCVAQASAATGSGDLPKALDYNTRAISFVSDSQHPQFAFVWCDRADLERELSQNEDASRSYEQCNAWTQGDRDLQMIRDRAAQGLASLGGPGITCQNVDQCIAQAGGMRQDGNLEGALDSYIVAISLIPAHDHPSLAGIWCDRADIEKELGRREDAIQSYTTCSDWTQGDPAFQPMRDRAAYGLAELK